jgi:CheY-like chemotaxis protein
MTRPGYILIIEDDDDIREALTQILELEGYTVREAANGREALDISSREPLPSLILLDLMMPVMDGWEVMRALVANAALAHVPVIVLSGAGDLMQEVQLLGAVACIGKPFKVGVLLDAIERYALPAA